MYNACVYGVVHLCVWHGALMYIRYACMACMRVWYVHASACVYGVQSQFSLTFMWVLGNQTQVVRLVQQAL